MEYNNKWRVSSNVLWFIAIGTWLAGWAIAAIGEVDGAFAASGGMAIAFTTPFFGFSLVKTGQFSLEYKLAALNQRREENFGLGILSNANVEIAGEIKKLTTIAAQDAAKFESKLQAENTYFKAILFAQIGIVSVSSVIWSLGIWIEKVFICQAGMQCS